MRKRQGGQKMEVILYAPDSGQDGVQERIGGLIPQKRVKVYRTLEGLAERLHRPIDPETVLIIVTYSREKLLEVSPLRQVLGDVRTVVVAPDQEPTTVALAHQLRPRFLTYVNGDFNDLGAVLQKMTKGDGRD